MASLAMTHGTRYSSSLEAHLGCCPQESAPEQSAAPPCCALGLLYKLLDFIDDIMWRKLYAIIFATSFWSPSVMRLHRWACRLFAVGIGLLQLCHKFSD